jgi:hypothetical protein
MLRVEARNLPEPRGIPRSRRLLPNPPVPRLVSTATRHELVPPPVGGESRSLAPPPSRVPPRERWSVHLELGDDEIAKLYGQGMARGAVVWKKGMVEWRPLLITPELSGLLRRTRITLPPPPVESAEAQTEVATVIPPPARVPSELPPPAAPMHAPIPSVAPIALDVVEASSTPRRSFELLAVAAAAFAFAWFAHARLRPPTPRPIVAATAAMASAAACEGPQASILTSGSSPSGIRTVAVADLPLAGRGSAATGESRAVAPASGGSRRAKTDAAGGPSRADLVGALSRVASVASGCGERGGPVRIVMSFAPSGVARSIQVSGADLPAQTRSCIIGAASRARVPAFSGEAVTVSKTL